MSGRKRASDIFSCLWICEYMCVSIPDRTGLTATGKDLIPTFKESTPAERVQ